MFHRTLPLRGLLVAVAALLAGAGCGDDADSADTQRVDDVAALASMLHDVDDGCTLEYEGLTDDQREVSICTLGGDVAELAVWTDLEALEALREATQGTGDPVVTGPNWSIDVSSADLADQVAEATGGSVTQ